MEAQSARDLGTETVASQLDNFIRAASVLNNCPCLPFGINQWRPQFAQENLDEFKHSDVLISELCLLVI